MSFDCLCMKCGKEKAIVESSGKFFCEKCGTEHSKELWNLTQKQGGKIIDKDTPLPAGTTQIPLKPTVQLSNVQVIFEYSNGSSKTMRITHAEKMQIAEKIMNTRKKNKVNLEYLPVAILPEGFVREALGILNELKNANIFNVKALRDRANELLPDKEA